MLRNIFRKRVLEKVGEPLYASVAAQSRQTGFYTLMGVADRIDARFEVYTLHVLLLILRLRDEDLSAEGVQTSGPGGEAAQSLFDVYVSALDNALRELGVGDTSMARKMRSLGEALYGRMVAYESPLRQFDEVALSHLLARNVFGDENAPGGAELARYAIAARRQLADQRFEDILGGPVWPAVAA